MTNSYAEDAILRLIERLDTQTARMDRLEKLMEEMKPLVFKECCGALDDEPTHKDLNRGSS